MYSIYSWSQYNLDFWPQGQIFTRVFDMSSCLTHNFCFHHIRHLGLSQWDNVSWHSWSRYDVDLLPQGQIYSVFKKVSQLGHSFFVLWHSCTIFGTWESHYGTMCHIHSWPLYDPYLLPQYQNYINIFTMNLFLGKIIFALWHRHTKVSPWDKMLLYIYNTPRNELWRV